MTARILIVDESISNLVALEALLAAEYFRVLSAMNGADALKICASGACDLVLIDALMPDMDAFEVCRRLKQSPETFDIPVILLTARERPEDRLRGLEAGADDFLTRPLDETSLFTRVRSLVRLKSLSDSLLGHLPGAHVVKRPGHFPGLDPENGQNGKILLLDDQSASAERIALSLRKCHEIETISEYSAMEARILAGDADLLIISLDMREMDPLRLVALARSEPKTRNRPILVLAEPERQESVKLALGMNVNDYLLRPVDRNELMARVAIQIRKWRYAAKIEADLKGSIALSAYDPLTNLDNRRTFERRLREIFDRAPGGPNVLLVIDVDHFKRVNDTFGHIAGDEVLCEIANRLRGLVRQSDAVARIGGEEFVVIMPDTNLATGEQIAERIRQSFAEKPFPIEGGREHIRVTASIGLALTDSTTQSPEMLMRAADRALYAAKRGGRNRIETSAA